MTDEKKKTTKKAVARKTRVTSTAAKAKSSSNSSFRTGQKKSKVSPSKRKTKKRVKKSGRWRPFFERIFMRNGEVSSWAIWTAVVLVVLAHFVIIYFFFVRPYMEGKREKELYFLRPQVHGVDISHYQGRINWDKLCQAVYKDYPINFVFMKATEGGDYVDRTFQQNFAAARDFGLVRGAYHFYQPSVPAEQQALSFISQVKLQPGDLPPVLDIEVLGDESVEDLQRGVRTWLVRVEEHYGVKPIIYASYSFKKDYLKDSFFDAYPYWIAHYNVDSLKYKGTWAFWQHTDMGNVDGVNGYVDLDIFNGNLEELMELTIK